MRLRYQPALIAAAVQPEPRSWLRAGLAVGPMVWIGRISYGLYLWHWPIDVFVSSARTGLAGVPLTVLRLTVTFAIATASFYLVELPIRERRFSPRVSTVLAPTTAALTALVIVTTTPASAAVPSYLGGGAVSVACPGALRSDIG